MHIKITMIIFSLGIISETVSMDISNLSAEATAVYFYEDKGLPGGAFVCQGNITTLTLAQKKEIRVGNCFYEAAAIQRLHAEPKTMGALILGNQKQLQSKWQKACDNIRYYISQEATMPGAYCDRYWEKMPIN